MMMLLIVFSQIAISTEFELNNRLGIESRYFFHQPQSENQLEHFQSSVFIESELYWSWDQGQDSVTFKPYYRHDQHDNNRSHGDIRELSYVYTTEKYDIRAGIRKEFWGVTEFQHLVDVINQTDLVEDIDGENKLGQLMLNLSLVEDWGILDLFILPGFRERTFPGEVGRLRTIFLVQKNNAQYQSSAENKHVDYAIRWNQSIGNFDIGSSWFNGTSREPLFILSPDIKTNTNNAPSLTLHPFYQQMNQLGIDVQATFSSWLYKMELIYRDTDTTSFLATQAGFEFTHVGFFNSATDVGLLIEYGWDSRGETTRNNQGAQNQNDLFLGSRIAFNDIQSSEILIGISYDLEHHSIGFSIEANRRLFDNYTVNFDMRIFNSSEPFDFYYHLTQDDHIQLSIERFF